MGENTNKAEFRKVVKEFGNGGHITLPKQFIGEEMVIKQATEKGSSLSPPITKEKIKTVLSNATPNDFSFRTREKDTFPREGEYQYDNDIRLSIDVELVWEGDGFQILDEEEGRTIHKLYDATSEELIEHTDWWTEEYSQKVIREKEDGTKVTPTPEPVLLAIDPSASDLFDHANTGYGDAYRYSIQWNGSEIESVMFCNRTAKNGRFYIPFWGKYESLEKYKSTIDYSLATAISEAPSDEYNQYLQIMTKRGIGWGGNEDTEATNQLSHEEILEQAIICPP